MGLIVLINTVQNRNFKNKSLDRKKYLKEIQKPDHIGINAFSIAEITGIPRATVVRKLEFLIKNKFLNISEKKLIDSKKYRHIKASLIVAVSHPWYFKGDFQNETQNIPE